MSADPLPRVPSARFTRNVRIVAVLWALLLAAFWVWGILEATADEQTSPFPLVLLAAVGGALLGWPATTLWRWAGQPRLSNDQHGPLRWELRGAERRALARAVRRGDPPPEGLEEWALLYCRAQHQLVPVGCIVLFTAATNVPGLLISTSPGVIEGIQAGAAAFSAFAGIGMLAWARRATVVAARWSTPDEARPCAACPPSFPPGATPPTVPWRDGDPRFDPNNGPDVAPNGAVPREDRKPG